MAEEIENLAKLRVDPHTCTIEELQAEIKRLESIKDIYNTNEQSIKVFLNSCYGACASIFFRCYNVVVAEAITLQGQDLIKFTNRIIDDYFMNKWHLDKELHEKLGLKDSIVNKINASSVIYNDTDSVDGSSIVKTESGEMTIGELYNLSVRFGHAGVTCTGHESVFSDDKILNFGNGELYYAPINRVIRHNVSKPKWKLKTKSGKEIIMTGDHSMIVFREGYMITVKPNEILKTDKVLSVVE
jgi:intein/homing endonuclease